MKIKKISFFVFSVVSLIISLQIVIATTFSDVFDVRDHATPEMVVFRLQDVSPNIVLEIINLSNVTTIPISAEQANELGSPHWFWKNNTFYRILPLLQFNQRYIENITFLASKEILMSGDISSETLKNLLETFDPSCATIELEIKLNVSNIKHDYPTDFEFPDLEFLTERYQQIISYEPLFEGYRYSKYDCLNGNTMLDPFSEYSSNISVRLRNRILKENITDDNKSIHIRGNVVYLEEEFDSDFPKPYVYWGRLRDDLKSLNSTRLESQTNARFINQSIIITKKKTSYWVYTALLILSILCTIWIYYRTKYTSKQKITYNVLSVNFASSVGIISLFIVLEQGLLKSIGFVPFFICILISILHPVCKKYF